MLHLDGDRGVGTLGIGTGDDDHVDVGRCPAGVVQGDPRRLHGHFGLVREFVFAAMGNARAHPRRVERAVLDVGVAAADTGCFLDEFRAGIRLGLERAGGDRVAMLCIVAVDPGVVGGYQLLVADTVRRTPKTRAADDHVGAHRLSLSAADPETCSTCAGALGNGLRRRQTGALRAPAGSRP
jgi:hypothetical protein